MDGGNWRNSLVGANIANFRHVIRQPPARQSCKPAINVHVVLFEGLERYSILAFNAE